MLFAIVGQHGGFYFPLKNYGEEMHLVPGVKDDLARAGRNAFGTARQGTKLLLRKISEQRDLVLQESGVALSHETAISSSRIRPIERLSFARPCNP